MVARVACPTTSTHGACSSTSQSEGDRSQLQGVVLIHEVVRERRRAEHDVATRGQVVDRARHRVGRSTDGHDIVVAEQLVAAMKASLEGGKVKELDASKVTNWEAVEDESFDGEDFQVGIATYKEMTILGEKTLQAKALFSEGKLDKWIHAKTGMEIR